MIKIKKIVSAFLVIIVSIFCFLLTLNINNSVKAAMCNNCYSSDVSSSSDKGIHTNHCNFCNYEWTYSCYDYDYNEICDECGESIPMCSVCKMAIADAWFLDSHEYISNDGCSHTISCIYNYSFSDGSEACVDSNSDGLCDVCNNEICTDTYCILYDRDNTAFTNCRGGNIPEHVSKGDTVTFLTNSQYEGEFSVAGIWINIVDKKHVVIPCDSTVSIYLHTLHFFAECDTCGHNDISFTKNNDGTHKMTCTYYDCQAGDIDNSINCTDLDGNHKCDFCNADMQYTVSFDVNGGTGSVTPDTSKYKVGASITLPSIGSVAKTDYKFVGWSTNKSATTGSTGSYTITSNDVKDGAIKFYAIWQEIKYNITYNLNGASGTAPTDTTSYSKNAAVTLKAVGVTYTGYKFLGWSKSSTDTSGGTSYTVNKSDADANCNITLYAIWLEKNVVSITTSAQTYTYGDDNIKFNIVGSSLTNFTISYKVNDSYIETVPTNAGTYSVKVVRAEDDNNKAFSTELDNALVINKKTFNMQGVDWDYTTAFTFDGSSKEVKLTGLPDGITPSYTNNSKINAGSYTASVSFSYDTANCNAPTSISDLSWDISKATIVMTSVQWNYTNAFTYDGSSKEVKLTGLPVGVTASYTNNSKTNSGSYVAKATLTYDSANFNEPSAIADLSWNISKASYNMANASWDYTTAFVFDGLAKEVQLTGLPQGVTATYTNNSKTNAGSYTAKAIFTYDEANYNAPTIADLSWEISPKTVDVIWEVKDFVYSGAIQVIKASYKDIDNHDVALNVSTGNEFKEVGSYTATATFANNETNYVLSSNNTKTYSISASKEMEVIEVEPSKKPEEGTKVELVGGSLDPECGIVVQKEEIELTETIIQNIKTEVSEKSELILVFDIHIDDGQGEEVANIAGNSYKVTLAIPENLLGRTGYAVVYIDNDGNVEKYDVEVDGNKVTFMTTHFSTWGVVADEVKDGASVGGVILIILCVLILAFIGLFAAWKIEFKKAQELKELDSRTLKVFDVIFNPIDKLIFVKKVI